MSITVLKWDKIFNLGKLSHSSTTSPIIVSDWKHSKCNLKATHSSRMVFYSSNPKYKTN